MGVMVQHRKYNSPVNVPNKPSSSDRVGEWEGGVPGHARTVTPVTTAAAPRPRPRRCWGAAGRRGVRTPSSSPSGNHQLLTEGRVLFPQ